MSKFYTKDIERLRRDFELGLCFGKPGLPHYVGCARRITVRVDDKDAKIYSDAQIQAAWVGYQMAAKYAHGLLERYDVQRFISPGMVTQFRGSTAWSDVAAYSDEDVHNLIRAALSVAGGTPS